MDSKKTLFAIIGGVALTTAIGFLLTPYKDSSKRKKIVNKAKDYADNAEETIKGSVANVKSRVKKMGEDAQRMINEGGQ
ncbi:MAG: hypothetical protein ACQEST_12500 [Bacteroidota bacterium]